jgi:hypothetical protein
MFLQAFAACFCGADTVPTRKWRRGMAKLTKRTIDALRPKAKAYVAYDSELHGFGVRIMPSGHKSFIIEYRPHGGGRSVATRRLTLGGLGALTPDQGAPGRARGLGARPARR